jgi:eukaryotic-like serine/threonine-protein kinase
MWACLGAPLAALCAANPVASGASTPPSMPSTPATASAQFRGDATHSGRYSGPGVAELHGVRWRFQTGGPVVASPAVSRDALFIGSYDGQLYALDRVTGALRWKLRTGGRVTSSPALAGGAVYFSSLDGNIYAVDAASGALRWKFATGGERRYTAPGIHGLEPATEQMPDPYDFFLSSPAIAGGVLYVGSGDAHVYALDAASGRLRWKFRTGDVVHASPAVADGRVYIGSWDSHFYALDAATGAELWRFKTGDDPRLHNQVGIQASALVADGRVYFGCRDSKLYALEAATGKLVWSFSNKGAWVVGAPVLDAGRIYFANSDGGTFHALDARTGASVFSLRPRWPAFSSPALAGGLLYMGTHDGRLLMIDPARAAIGWSFQVEAARSNATRYSTPDGAPDYARVYDDMSYESAVIGTRRIMAEMGAILSSPVVADGVVYFGSMDGSVYALS